MANRPLIWFICSCLKSIALRKDRHRCNEVFRFQTTNKEFKKAINEMSAAQLIRANEPGSPRWDGREADAHFGISQLNPYSCLSCRKKKKKCNRVYPCANCRKAGDDCLFVPRRPSTRPKTTQGMLERLQHLEGVIGHLRENYNQGVSQLFSEKANTSIKANSRGPKAISQSHSPNGRGARKDDVAELGTELGRLAVGEGRSRYISSSFWASLDEEVRCRLPIDFQ